MAMNVGHNFYYYRDKVCERLEDMDIEYKIDVTSIWLLDSYPKTKLTPISSYLNWDIAYTIRVIEYDENGKEIFYKKYPLNSYTMWKRVRRNCE